MDIFTVDFVKTPINPDKCLCIDDFSVPPSLTPDINLGLCIINQIFANIF